MLVLASNSPRRRQLLSIAGLDFHVLAAQVDEQVVEGEPPADYVMRLAVSKAQASAASMVPIDSDAIIIAADTAVVDRIELGESSASRFEILGKPAHEDDAELMLRRLRGRIHQVYTGLAVLRVRDGQILKDVCITDVPMRQYSDEEMAAYIATGDPMDKAGAYAIQHREFHPVDDLKGCFANVMGLPVCHLARLLWEFGIYPELEISSSCTREMDYQCDIYQQVYNPGGLSDVV